MPKETGGRRNRQAVNKKTRKTERAKDLIGNLAELHRLQGALIRYLLHQTRGR